MAFMHSDDLPQDKATWERMIKHRKMVLGEARASGDPAYIKKAEEALNKGLENYKRDVLS